jgi:probable F420-dependent oxidoreductase
VLPYRHPLVVAKQAATIDQLSGGRLTLAVGVGFLRGEFDALGVPPFAERAAVTEEYIAVLRQAWETPGPVSFQGRYVRFSDVHARPGPAQQPSLPLWVGGNHPRALRRAGELGDGWHPLWPALADYRRQRGLIEGLREAARRDGPFTFSYSCPEMRITEQPAPAKPYSHAAVQGAADFGYVPPLPTADDGRTMFSGTAEQVAADVSAAAAAGVDQLSVRFWAGSPDVPVDRFVAQMELFMRRVAPP